MQIDVSNKSLWIKNYFKLFSEFNRLALRLEFNSDSAGDLLSGVEKKSAGVDGFEDRLDRRANRLSEDGSDTKFM